jgi:hypothetical protein
LGGIVKAAGRKSEYPKFETGLHPAPRFGPSNFGFVSDFGFRASDFKG